MRAIGWLVLTRAGLRLLSFDRLRALIATRPPAGTPASDAWPRAVRRAVLRAARSLPRSSCLAQSLVAERLLREGGHAARFSIGVADACAADETRVTLDAHAWVESGGVLVTGDDPREYYRILATFGAE